MTDMNEFLKSLPKGALSEDAVNEARTLYETLTDCFATSRTRVTDIVLSEDRHCVSVILRTPYFVSDNGSSGLFSDLLRVSDAVAIAPVQTEDGYEAQIVFTIAS